MLSLSLSSLSLSLFAPRFFECRARLRREWCVYLGALFLLKRIIYRDEKILKNLGFFVQKTLNYFDVPSGVVCVFGKPHTED